VVNVQQIFTGSGRGAAWLARLLGVQEVPSSNLGGPTKTPQRLTEKAFITECVLASTWSPKWDAARKTAAAPSLPGPPLLLNKTRQTRHFGPKLLIARD
jgi:hypothetical protein